MPDYKPVVFHDFAAGHMPEALTEQAVEALRDYGYSNAIQELRIELGRYLENKSLIDADPKHVFPIFAKYVEIWPSNYFDMEKVLGKDVARISVPRADVIPALAWAAVDYLEAFDKEAGEALKIELNVLITNLIGTKRDFLTIATKWLHRTGSTASDALSMSARKKKSEKDPTPVAA